MENINKNTQLKNRRRVIHAQLALKKVQTIDRSIRKITLRSLPQKKPQLILFNINYQKHYTDIRNSSDLSHKFSKNV